MEKGWDVRLAEKPLYGLQDDPISTVQESRSALRILSDSIKSPPKRPQITRTGYAVHQM
jgi:hypothetical protein